MSLFIFYVILAVTSLKYWFGCCRCCLVWMRVLPSSVQTTWYWRNTLGMLPNDYRRFTYSMSRFVSWWVAMLQSEITRKKSIFFVSCLSSTCSKKYIFPHICAIIYHWSFNLMKIWSSILHNIHFADLNKSNEVSRRI